VSRELSGPVRSVVGGTFRFTRGEAGEREEVGVG